MFELIAAHRRPAPRPYRFITVIGNVGAGKSTLTRALADALGYQASYERVANNPYLDDFYHDQKTFALPLQIFFLAQRYRDILHIQQQELDHIQDRSIYEDVEIFAPALYEAGKMTERDFVTYRDLFHNMVDHLIKPDLAIYLHGSLETVLGRIHLRGRDMEKVVPVDYWADLHARYDRLMAKYDHSPVLKVNIDEFDIHRYPEQLPLLVAEIERFLGPSSGRQAK